MQPRERDEEEREIEIEGAEDGEDADRADTAEAEAAEKTRRAKKKLRAPKHDLAREVEELSDELEKVSAELEGTKDKFLRGLADFDNYRKRIARERERLTRCANEDLIKRLLEVVDNIERALAAAGETDDLKAFKRGIELIDQNLKDILTKEGLCPIECLGREFDPNYHEAVMAIDKKGTESDQVVEEVQKGYTLDGRVIRPSKVVVSK